MRRHAAFAKRSGPRRENALKTSLLLTPRARPDVLLDLRGIDYRIGTRSILQNIFLQIARGQIVTLIGPNGAGKTTLIKIAMGLLEPHNGQVLRAPVTLVFDVASLVARDAKPVAGSIALDLFAGKTITVDLPGRRLIIESPSSLQQRIAGARELPVLLSREVQGHALAVSMGVATASGMLWFELDTGNGGTLLVSRPYAALFGLDPAIEGPQQADFAVAAGLRASGAAFTPDMILDGNLGMPFLRDKVITLDLQSGRLWIAQGKP